MAAEYSLHNKNGSEHTDRFGAGAHRHSNPVLPADEDEYEHGLTNGVDAVTPRSLFESKIRLLLAELQSGNNEIKAQVVKKLIPIFERFAIPSPTVTQVWAEAQLCLDSPRSDARKDALRLMRRCIQLQRDDLHGWQLVSYYQQIQKHNNDVEELLLSAHALQQLTDEGKNVEDISKPLLILLSHWLDKCLKSNRPGPPPSPQWSEVRSLSLRISEDVLRYSWSKIATEDVTNFIDFLCNHFGGSISTIDDVGEVLRVIEVIPKYGAIVPVAAVRHIITFLCTYTAALHSADHQERLWNIMQSFLCLDRFAYKSLTTLEAIPAQTLNIGLEQRRKQKHRIRGALIFLRKCLELQDSPNEHKEKVSISKVLECIGHAIYHSDLSVTQIGIQEFQKIGQPGMIRRFTFENWETVWNFLAALVTQFNDACRLREIAPADFTSFHRHDLGRTQESTDLNAIVNSLNQIVPIFHDFCVTEDYRGSLPHYTNFLLTLSAILPDTYNKFILSYYDKSLVCMPANADWLSECEVMLEDFIRDESKATELRIQAITVLMAPIRLITQEDKSQNVDFFKRIATPLFTLLRTERNREVCQHLIRLAVIVGNSERAAWGIDICRKLYMRIVEGPPNEDQLASSKFTSRSMSSVTSVFEEEEEEDDYLRLESMKGLVEIFENSLLRDSSELTREVYGDIVELAQNFEMDLAVRLEALDVLLRLRADSLYTLYMVDRLPRRHGQIVTSDVSRIPPARPLTKPWLVVSVPVANGIQSPAKYHSRTRIKSCEDHSSYDEDDEETGGNRREAGDSSTRVSNILPVSAWLDVVIRVCRENMNWKLYYHVLEHFADQLLNKTLFAACHPGIIRLREIICSQLLNANLAIRDLNNQQRTEVFLRLHRILTILIGYHDLFVKASRDELVRCFQVNMGRHNQVLTKQCIHSLMCCCHELPKSIARCLSGILQTLSQQITNPALSVHILEFLVGAGRIPQIHGNFTSEEFFMVFQVALRYLQHSRATSRDRPGLADTHERMSQYIGFLAYEALTVWFLAVKLESRRSYVAWIIRQLILAHDGGKLDDHAIVFIDMLERFSYSDSPLKKYPDPVDVEGLAQYKKHYVVGRSVQTAQVVRGDGLVKITVRKPSSMLVTYMQAEIDFESDAIRLGRKVLTQAELKTLPSYMITQMHATDQPPIHLVEDEATLRSIRSLDRMPVVNFHTIGITYVGWGQTTEEEILSNEVGSAEYHEFLDAIGSTVRLKGNTEIYHGGLDIQDDQDGTHAYFWSDRTTQITFITYTMIPLNREGDRQLALSNKKRNAANCFVNIIWNDSNEPYFLNTIASEFNSNSIVISRHSRSPSAVDTVVSRTISATKEPYFKVKLLQTEGMPEVSPVMEEKILSANSLPSFIYIGRREKSHWVARLDQIKQIRERAMQKRNSDTPALPRGAFSPSVPNATLPSIGRRTASADMRPEPAMQVEDEQMAQLLAKYDFTRYT